MSTTVQIHELVQPYVSERDDLVLVGRAIILKPIRHLLRGYFIDRTSWKGGMKPRWFVNLMFRPQESTGFQWTGRLQPTYGEIEDDDFPQRLFKAMDVAFHELRKIESANDICKLHLVVDLRREDQMAYRSLISTSIGNFDVASEELSEYIKEVRGWNDRDMEFIRLFTRRGSRAEQRKLREYAEGVRLLDRIIDLHALVQKQDRHGIADLLREWERNTAKAWKIDHLWEPTPFPFEEDAI